MVSHWTCMGNDDSRVVWMKKGDLIVGKVRMNPMNNKLVPCIELLLFEGLTDEQLVLLEVKNAK